MATIRRYIGLDMLSGVGIQIHSPADTLAHLLFGAKHGDVFVHAAITRVAQNALAYQAAQRVQRAEEERRRW